MICEREIKKIFDVHLKKCKKNIIILGDEILPYNQIHRLKKCWGNHYPSLKI